ASPATSPVSLAPPSLHDALPIASPDHRGARARGRGPTPPPHRPLRPPADRPGPARGNEDGHERPRVRGIRHFDPVRTRVTPIPRSEEHTSELQPPDHLACRLPLE